MSKTTFNYTDFVLLREKYGKGNLFDLDIEKKKENKGKHKTYYIPFTCKTLEGGVARLHVKFIAQVISSNAKAPKKDANEPIKNMMINFSHVDEERMSKTDYDLSQHQKLIDLNHAFVEALEIISQEYQALVDNQVLKQREVPIKVKTINSFAQYERDVNSKNPADKTMEKTESGRILLDHPIYRIKLPVETSTSKIGVKYGDKPFNYVVFDQRIKRPDGKPTPATVKSTNGESIDLNTENADKFITYMSLSGGMIEFNDIVISKSGISMSNQFKVLHIKPHKRIAGETFTSEEMDEFDNGFVEDVIDVPRVAPKQKSPTNRQPESDGEDDLELGEDEVPIKPSGKKNKAADDDVEPDDNNAADAEEEIEQKKPVKAVVVKKTGKKKE